MNELPLNDAVNCPVGSVNVKCEPVSITSPSVSLNLILTNSSEDADAWFVFSIDEDTKIISGALFVVTLQVNGVSVVVPNALVCYNWRLLSPLCGCWTC